MVVVGDSDFLSNAYVELSGNKDFALNIIQWLAKDDRFIAILRSEEPEFKPLFLDARQRFILMGVTIGVTPAFFLLAGALCVYWRRRTT